MSRVASRLLAARRGRNSSQSQQYRRILSGRCMRIRLNAGRGPESGMGLIYCGSFHTGPNVYCAYCPDYLLLYGLWLVDVCMYEKTNLKRPCLLPPTIKHQSLNSLHHWGYWWYAHYFSYWFIFHAAKSRAFPEGRKIKYLLLCRINEVHWLYV